MNTLDSVFPDVTASHAQAGGDDTFYKMPKTLMCCTHIVVGDKHISFSSTEKDVYILLSTRIGFFNKQYKNYCYDNQEGIAAMCGISVRQAGRILSKFIDLGILKAEKINPRKWVYIDISSLQVISPNGDILNVDKEVFTSNVQDRKKNGVVVKKKQEEWKEAFDPAF